MSELLMTKPERKLWFDGPNYTADGIVIHPESANILLVRRKSGEWALPGGFIDPGEVSLVSAIREVKEETGIAIEGGAPLVFRGIVDDPRNSETAWIETAAHLFVVERMDEPHPDKEEVDDAEWVPLNELPELYASHASILERAFDHLAGEQLMRAFSQPDAATRIDAGHMEYNKSICEKDGVAVFAKQHEFEKFIDSERANRSYHYLEKEAFTMAHLRQHGFTHVPDRSVLYGDTLAMDALRIDDGWKWRANSDTIDAYITDSLEALRALAVVPVPADSFTIDPSYESFASEGWRAFTDETRAQLEQRFIQFSPRLTQASQLTAQEMLTDLNDLQHIARMPRTRKPLVFCHHDLRQSNLAWHPDHGSKLVDWSWAGLGESGSDQTSLLIDLHKSGHDVATYYEHVNAEHCLTLLGFWLAHSTWPIYRGDDSIRFQQFVSALSAYDLLQQLP